jgi:hypothetical protein
MLLPLSIALMAVVLACTLPALYRATTAFEAFVASLERSVRTAPTAYISPEEQQAFTDDMRRREVMEWQIEHGLEPTGVLEEPEQDGPLSDEVQYVPLAQIR